MRRSALPTTHEEENKDDDWDDWSKKTNLKRQKQ